MDILSTVNSYKSCIFSKLPFNGIVHSRTQSILMQTLNCLDMDCSAITVYMQISKFSPPA